MRRTVTPTKVEVFFRDLIVSKTDVKGRITYANEEFCKISGYAEGELLGQQHSIVRHPEMPRAVFKLLWDVILDGREIFAYVKNMTKGGDFYWVFAHVTPSYDANRQIIGFHSNRRVPNHKLIDAVIAPLYADLLREENAHHNGKDALAAGHKRLTDFVAKQKMTYDELILTL